MLFIIFNVEELATFFITTVDDNENFIFLLSRINDIRNSQMVDACSSYIVFIH